MTVHIEVPGLSSTASWSSSTWTGNQSRFCFTVTFLLSPGDGDIPSRVK